MKTLSERRKELDNLTQLLISLNILKEQLPPFVFTEDIKALLDELKYLRGYLDSMIHFKNELSQLSD